MVENIKNHLWDILKKKHVFLIMIFDKNGNILWSRGRQIEGKSIHIGFSRSFAKKVIAGGDVIKQENVQIMVSGNQLSESVLNLNVKTLLILPIKPVFFLYVDSGTCEHFTDNDLELFRILGELLEQTIEQAIVNEKECKGISGSSQAISRVREIVIRYALEEEPVLLLGETGVKKSHIIVAASTQDLHELISRKEFREDLYYRLHILEIYIPPLRDRKEDIRAFIDSNYSYLKYKEIGEGFWEVMKTLFLNQDLNRGQVKAIANDALNKTKWYLQRFNEITKFSGIRLC